MKKPIANRCRPKHALFIMLLAAMSIFAASASAATVVTLKVYQGFKFSDQTVTINGDKQADLSFFVNQGRQGAYSFALGALGGAKIKEFGTETPGARDLSPETVAGWKSYVNAPSPGMYVVQGADGQSLYLIKVISFENQGKASSFWKLNFSWEKIR